MLKSRIGSQKFFGAAFLITTLLCFAIALNVSAAPKAATQTLVGISYLSPIPAAEMVSPGTSVAFRTSDSPSSLDLSRLTFDISGASSGQTAGRIKLASDGKTIIFDPSHLFEAGETVNVHIRYGSASDRVGEDIVADYQFYIAQNELQTSGPSEHLWNSANTRESLTSTSRMTGNGRYRTAPSDLPVLEKSGTDTFDPAGYIFMSYFAYLEPGSLPVYLLILDNNAEPIYYQNMDPLPVVVDFKKQPNGLLTYYDPHPNQTRFRALNNNYEIVASYGAGNGYTTDLHDLQLLDNGHALLLIYDVRQIDMSKIYPGGHPQARVTGCVIQELDTNGNVVFEWRSWDHFNILDTWAPLDAEEIRYVHCNAIEKDHDGNLLLSSRNLSEVTKINRQTGDIIWRMGGSQNEFTFVNDIGFDAQHDVRRQGDGTLTIYDNGINHVPSASRGVRYVVDEDNKMVTRVSQYRLVPDHYALAMGNLHLTEAATAVVGWGRSNDPIMTEFSGPFVPELSISSPDQGGSYRVFRFPWQGFPKWPPVLVAESGPGQINLYFSWNGATEIASYRILAGKDSESLTQIATIPRQGFETAYKFNAVDGDAWHFQVIPVDKNGLNGLPSNISRAAAGTFDMFVPFATAAE